MGLAHKLDINITKRIEDYVKVLGSIDIQERFGVTEQRLADVTDGSMLDRVTQYLEEYSWMSGDYRFIFEYDQYVIKIDNPSEGTGNRDELYCHKEGKDLPLVPIVHHFMDTFFGLVLVCPKGAPCQSYMEIINNEILGNVLRMGSDEHGVYPYLEVNEKHVLVDLDKLSNFCYIGDKVLICDGSCLDENNHEESVSLMEAYRQGRIMTGPMESLGRTHLLCPTGW